MIFNLPLFHKNKKEVKMAFAGDIQVLKNLLYKKKLLEKNDPSHKKIKTVLIAPGGGERGVVLGGVGVALEKLGLVDSFDYLIGISIGAAGCLYLLSGEAALGTSIIFEDNVRNHFFNPFRFWKIFDIKASERAVRYVKPADLDKFRKSRPKCLMVVTDVKTGNAKFVDAKKAEDPEKVVIASSSFPLATGIKLGNIEHIDGRICVDGCPGNPLPISYAINHLKATDILVILTSPLSYYKDAKVFKWILDKTIYKELTPGLRWDLEHYTERYNEELKYILGERKLPKNVRLAVIYPEEMPIKATTMNKEVLEEGAVKAMSFTEKLFENIKI